MTTPADDGRPTLDDVMEPQDDALPRPIYQGHAGMPERLDDNALAEATEQERVDAGLADYDPDQVPPATEPLPDGSPDQPDVTETEQYQQELAEAHRVAQQQRGD